jgi:hypothetical protein
VREAIFSEFNTLSVLYKAPSATFIAADHLVAAMPEPPVVAAAVAQDDDRLLTGDEDAPLAAGGGASRVVAAAPAAAPAAPADLIDDLLGMGFGGGGAAAPAPAPAGASRLVAVGSGAALDSGAFQARWGALAASPALALQAQRLPPGGSAEVEAWARGAGLATIASGDTGAALKWFVYGQDDAGGFHLAEIVLDKSNGAVVATVKSDVPAAAHVAAAAIRAALAGLGV